MTRKTLGALVAFNLALLLALVTLSFTPNRADAQLGGGGGDYTMIAAQRNGRTPHAVYLIDTRQNIMLSIEPSARGRNSGLEVTGLRDITNDFNARAAGR